MLFPVRFGRLFRQRNIKYLPGSRRKVFQFFLSGRAKMDAPRVAGYGPNRVSILMLRLLRKVSSDAGAVWQSHLILHCCF